MKCLNNWANRNLSTQTQACTRFTWVQQGSKDMLEMTLEKKGSFYKCHFAYQLPFLKIIQKEGCKHALLKGKSCVIFKWT